MSTPARRLTLYDVLGLPMDCSAADIEAAHRRRLAQWHPATRPGQDNDSCCCILTQDERAATETALAYIEKAHVVLSNPRLRHWYDEQLLGPRMAMATAALREGRAKYHPTQGANHGGKSDTNVTATPASLTDSLTTQQRARAMAESSPSTGEGVQQYATADGGHVTVAQGVETDPDSGAVLSYKAIAYTSESHPTSENKSNEPPARLQQLKGEEKAETSKAADDDTAAGEGKRNGADSSNNTDAKNQRPVIQDFDPAMLALLPNRLHAALAQLLGTPLPPLEPLVIGDGGGGRGSMELLVFSPGPNQDVPTSVRPLDTGSLTPMRHRNYNSNAGASLPPSPTRGGNRRASILTPSAPSRSATLVFTSG